MSKEAKKRITKICLKHASKNKESKIKVVLKLNNRLSTSEGVHVVIIHLGGGSC